MKAVRRIAGAVVVYAALCAVVPSCVHLADRLVLWPQASTGAGSSAEQVLLGDAGTRLELWRVPCPEVRAYLIRFYGNANLADRWVAEEGARYADLGIEVWGVNYPGYGASDGPATLAGVARAADVAYANVKARAGEAPIIVMGTSLGTTAALHLAATQPLAGVVLINPPPLREVIKGEFGWWNLWILATRVAQQIPDALDSIANALAAKAPALFISAGSDEVVPPKYQQHVFAAYAGEKTIVVVPNARHNSPLPGVVQTQLRHMLETFITARR